MPLKLDSDSIISLEKVSNNEMVVGKKVLMLALKRDQI